MNTITLQIVEAHKAFNAVLPHISKDDVTPTITNAQLTTTHIIATDRYTIGKYEFEHNGHDEIKDTLGGNPDTQMLIPREAVEWVAKTQLNKLRTLNRKDPAALPITLTVEHDEKNEEITFTITNHGRHERSQTFDTGSGNYPDVNRLIETHKPATEPQPVKLKPEHLRKVLDVAQRWDKETPVQFELGHVDTGKPGPVKLTVGQLTALVQPNLMLP